MALVSKLSPVRKEIPHEPGEWVEIVPPSILDIDTANQEKDTGASVREASAGLMTKCVKGWSYGAPLTRESFSDLDQKTWDWLITAFSEFTVSDVEKKGSANGSSPTTAREAVSSPTSSGTS